MDTHSFAPTAHRLPTRGPGRTDGSHGPALNIALVTETYPPEVNGVAMTVGRLVDGLLRRGHRVQLIRPRQHRLDQASKGGPLSEVLMQGVPIPRYSGLLLGLPARRKLVKLWQEQPPDIVHVVTEGPLGASAVDAARQLRLPVTSGFHTNFHCYSNHYGLGWLNRPIAAYLRRLHNRTAATLVPTEQLAQQLAGIGYQNLAVVARGVDTELFSPVRRSAALRAVWGAEDGAPVVISVGRLAPEKNLPQVLEAFAAVRRRHPKAKLVFVGDGPSRGELQRSHPEAIFAGMRTGLDLAQHYASADIFLFPSLTETFGNVTLEALASGLAVVAYDYAAAAALIRDGDNGRKVPCGDGSAFTTAAAQLADPAVREPMRRCARHSVLHHDWEHIHDQFAATLRTARQLFHGHTPGNEESWRLLPD
jgi:glycosyltransferase involved in cell wall biosynthesis